MSLNVLKVLITTIILTVSSTSTAKQLKLEIELKDGWHFEIGDDMNFSRQDFNDFNWDQIEVAKKWEEAGYPGYDGFAWYRVSFMLPKELRGKRLYLRLGRIDDVDQTFLNGRFIAQSGAYPPKLKIAYDVERIYALTEKDLRYGEMNTIAIRVYDRGGAGGIVCGPVGIYSRIDQIKLDIPLDGQWEFKTGDDVGWAQLEIIDEDWGLIHVPSKWEKQGFTRYDGYAWYRKRVIIPGKLSKSELLLILGKINDIDEAYFNGQKIGGTGDFPIKWEVTEKSSFKGLYKKKRVYSIPAHLIQWDKTNIIAIRVLDIGGSGGIYGGDIGICTQEAYQRHLKNAKKD